MLHIFLMLVDVKMVKLRDVRRWVKEVGAECFLSSLFGGCLTKLLGRKCHVTVNHPNL
jgi:hypothetical protein